MDKELVIVVPSEGAAYEVVKELYALDVQGSIELYGSTVVTKAPDGTIRVNEKRDARGPFAIGAGITTGVMLGLLAGPLGAVAAAAITGTAVAGATAAAGAAVGATIGGAVGGVAGIGGDAAYSGLMGEFVHDVATRLQPGASAVLASVWEDWTVPVDTTMAPYGATIFRQATDDVVAAQIKADWQATKDDLSHVDAELKHAAGEEKAKLEAKREELRLKAAAQRERLEQRARRLEASWDAKIASIEAKAAASKAKAEARHREHAKKLSHFAATQKQAFHDLFA